MYKVNVPIMLMKASGSMLRKKEKILFGNFLDGSVVRVSLKQILGFWHLQRSEESVIENKHQILL